MNAIAGVLNGENADQWIETASNHIRPEIKKLVQEHLIGSLAQKRRQSMPVSIKTFKCDPHDEGQVEVVQAAIDRAKEITGAQDDSAALEVICRDYIDRGITTCLSISNSSHLS